MTHSALLDVDRIDDVLRFWFEELRPKDWWSAAVAIDNCIRVRFADLWRALREDAPRAADLDARGHLAAVIVFDQLTRHLHRDAALAFSCDPLALGLTIDAIDRGLDEGLSPPERQFLYMPLMHAESGALQARSLAMFERLGNCDAMRSAVAHARTFARFGRFPDRNAALGRSSTAEELAFLAKRAGPG